MKSIPKHLLLIPFLLLFTHISSAQTPCAASNAGGYPCNQVDLLAHIPLSGLNGGGSIEGSDIWGWTDTLTGKEIAIVCLMDKTAFVDVTNPTSPVYLGYLNKTAGAPTTFWRDVKVYNNYAFIVADAGGHGMQVFDLKQLRSVAAPPVVFTADHLFTGFGDAHNIVGFPEADYMVGVGSNACSGGLYFMDVSDPLRPVNDGCFDADGYTHDALCFYYQGPDTEHFGTQICIGSNGNSQTIVDVTDKTNPVQLSRNTYAGSSYSHQGWVTDDHKYLIFDDETDESNNSHFTRTYMMDISDLDNPVFMGYFESPLRVIDHNMYIKGQYAYQANYQGGLRILDVSDVANGNLTEVASFDTYPSQNAAAFNGAWSVYPYFKSGTIIVSDIESGLFVLRANLPHFVVESTKKPSYSCENQTVTFPINLDAYADYSDMVTLSVTGLPAGATATFGSNPLPASGSTTLTISNTAGITGPSSILVAARGPANNSVHQLSLSFTLQPLPGIPSLNVPADGALAVEPNNTVFSWSAVADADSYTLELSKDPAFGTLSRSIPNITGTSYVANPALRTGTTYYWRVKGVNACGITADPPSIAPYPDFEFTTSGVLPVELLDFRGERQDDNIELTWTTHSEINNVGFEILRGTPSTSFRKIGWIAGNGTTISRHDYTFTDTNTQSGETYYYQLRQLDEEGSATLSDVVSIKVIARETTYSLYPNPTKGSAQLSVVALAAEELQVSVFSIAGKEMATYDLAAVVGKNNLDLSTEDWAPGIYVVKIVGGRQQLALRLVVLKK